MILVSIAVFGMILVLLPLYYFFHQNYQIFSDLSYGNSSHLLQYVEQEKRWIHMLFFSAFVGFLVFVFLLGLRMTSQVVSPMKMLKSHLEKLANNEWAKVSLPVKYNEEFYDTIEAYNSFLSSYRLSLERDLHYLKLIKEKVKDPKFEFLLKKMIEEKKALLKGRETKKENRKEKGQVISWNALDDALSDDWPLVS